MKETIERLLGEIKSETNESEGLPQGCRFLPSGEILCTEREKGESRFPYDRDGLVVWAHSGGYIDACESVFNIFRCANYSEDAPIGFFAGFRTDEGFIPLSLLGPVDKHFAKRYVVYSRRCAYYITETSEAVFCVRVYTAKNKSIRFSLCAYPREKEYEITLTSFFEPLLRPYESEGFFNRMSRFGEIKESGNFVISCLNDGFDCLTVTPSLDFTPEKRYKTVSRETFMGGRGRCLANAVSLQSGSFSRDIKTVNTTDLPIASEIYHLTLNKEIRIDYTLSKTHKNLYGGVETPDNTSFAEADAELIAWEKEEGDAEAALSVSFDEFAGIDGEKYSRFLDCVKKQVSFCAFGKNYAGALMGVRDVFQQLETALLWQSETARAKIITALNFILSDGRAPRQFSYPVGDALPEFDLRPYIDQGLWIISTLYSYLCASGDFSILSEKCSYYDCEGTWGPVRKSENVDTVLDHLIKITDFLVSKIDPETGCLRALYGDWNDALDGLGRIAEEGEEYGSGVSVMATLQFYSALDEMNSILSFVGGYDGAISRNILVREGIEKGISEFAVCEKEGETRIAHGWGHKRCFCVGSFEDVDGENRTSITPNAFFAISGMLRKHPEMKEAVAAAILSLDSKYGLKTFDKPFALYTPNIGRIMTITPGTYENSCAYVHAGMFGTAALFMLGKSGEAWEQIKKSSTITHENATLTPFVMPNSYCENPGLQIDGDSMGDWYTGSGTVLIKNIVRLGFGILPTLDGVTVAPASKMPCKRAEISLPLKGAKLTLKYSDKESGERKFTVNGVDTVGEYDEISETMKLFIPASAFEKGDVSVTVCD